MDNLFNPLPTDPNQVEITHPELKRWIDMATPEGGVVDDLELLMVKDAQAIMNIISNQGHSGFSANYFISKLTKLLKLGVFWPIQDRPEDWNDISKYYGDDIEEKLPYWQHKTLSNVFKDKNGKCTVLDHNYYEDEKNPGEYYRICKSIEITFPFYPSMPEYIKLTDPRHHLNLGENNA